MVAAMNGVGYVFDLHDSAFSPAPNDAIQGPERQTLMRRGLLNGDETIHARSRMSEGPEPLSMGCIGPFLGSPVLRSIQPPEFVADDYVAFEQVPFRCFQVGGGEQGSLRLALDGSALSVLKGRCDVVQGGNPPL